MFSLVFDRKVEWPGPRSQELETGFVCGEVHEVRIDVSRFLGPFAFLTAR